MEKFSCDLRGRDGSPKRMSDPTTPDDETTRWFDEAFASTIKRVREPNPMTFESNLGYRYPLLNRVAGFTQ